MSMLRYLSPAGRPHSHKDHHHQHGSSKDRSSSHHRHGATSPHSPRHGHHRATPKLELHVPNYGIIILPSPAEVDADGNPIDEPRSDYMLHGELEVTLADGAQPVKVKAIRVGFRTIIKVDMGPNRKNEEDKLFERKVEIVGSSDDEGILINPGSQRFQFTIILPSNLAVHDWHPNGMIAHNLYAELEGLPEPEKEWSALKTVGSSTSLFSFRNKDHHKKSSPGSKAPSRGTSPAPPRGRSAHSYSVPASGASTPLGGGGAAQPHLLAGALATLALNPNGTVRTTASGSVSGQGSGVNSSNTVNPAYLSVAQSFSTTRQEAPSLPETPPYEIVPSEPKTAERRPSETPPKEWLVGTKRVDRKCMLVYNPNESGTSTDLDENANGFVNGLGAWDVEMLSDVWSVGALMRVKLKIASIPDTTTIFAARLLLAQTHTIISPRDEDGTPHKLSTTRNFTVMEAGRRPPAGHTHPDHHYQAIWRGAAVPGRSKKDKTPSSGDLVVDTKGRVPSDTVARPTTLPGVITPISVNHQLILEVFFSVYNEDDRGNKMPVPGPGGLRMLRVSRPTTVPSCILVPQVINLPSYEDHAKDKMAPLTPDVLKGDFSWTDCDWDICACGMKVDALEERMRDAAIAEASGQGTSLGQMAAAAAAEDKAWTERGRRHRGSV